MTTSGTAGRLSQGGGSVWETVAWMTHTGAVGNGGSTEETEEKIHTGGGYYPPPIFRAPCFNTAQYRSGLMCAGVCWGRARRLTQRVEGCRRVEGKPPCGWSQYG